MDNIILKISPTKKGEKCYVRERGRTLCVPGDCTNKYVVNLICAKWISYSIYTYITPMSHAAYKKAGLGK